MSGDKDDTQRALGRIEGQLAMMLTSQAEMSQKLDGVETRLQTFEKGAARLGGSMGALMGVGVAIITESAKQLFHNGGGS